MPEVTKNFVVTPAVTATGTLKRTVSDWIRRLNPVISPVLSLVKTLDVDPMGDASYNKGLISQEATDTMKFEWFTLTPITVSFTATGGSSTTAVFADATTFITRDVICNLNTKEVAIVDELTSTTALGVTAIGTWSCAADDTILLISNAQEEASSTAVSRTKEPSNNFNYCQISRFPISIADTAKESPHYGQPIWARYKQDNQFFTYRNLENQLLFSKKAVSETTSVTIDSTAYSMYTTRGLYDYAGVTFDCSGTMTFDRWNTDLFNALPRTLKPTSSIKMLCGKRIWSQLNSWVAQKLIYMESGEKDEFGATAKKFMCGAYWIEPIMHDAFNEPININEALIFDTEDLVYRYKSGYDLHIKENIQLPSAMGTTQELRGAIGFQVKSAGANIVKLTNWAA